MSRRSDIAYHLPRLAVAALFVLPLLWVLSASLRQTGLAPPRTVEWLPDPIAWSNYRRLFELVPMATYLVNSAIVVAIAVPVTLVTASLAGFAMTQMPPRIRRILVMFAVMLLMVPSVSLWLTRFLIFKQLGLIDTIGALVAPALMGSSPLYVLLYYWTFRRIPRVMFETARLHGATLLQTWFRIAMPMARPTTFAVAVLCFVLYWSDFIGPLLYLKSERLYTLPVGLESLHQLDTTNWSLLMAGALVMMAPVIVLFLFVQRYFWPEYHRL